MRIGINLLYLLPGVVGGTETYARGLLKGLAGLDTKHEFLVFVNQESRDWDLPGGFTRIVCPVHAISRSRRYAFEQFGLPFLLKKNRKHLLFIFQNSGGLHVFRTPLQR